MSLIEIDGVRKTYRSGELVLDNLTMTIERGEVACLIGPSGSGKSTALRCINRLEGIDGGDIRINGVSLPDHHRELRQWRSRIGFVFQGYNLFPHLSAGQNVALPLQLVKGFSKDEARMAASEALASVGLPEKFDSFPDQLSGGQQQRVAIARELARKPEFLMFDEPTAALDPELTNEVINLMAKLAAENVTMLVVTHEMRFVKQAASSVYFLHGGRILEQGSPSAVLDSPRSEECRRFVATI